MEVFNRDHSFPAKGALLGLPPQAISTKKKNRKWKEDCMDALETIGLKQYDRNQMYRDYYGDGGCYPSVKERAEAKERYKDTFFLEAL